MSSPDLTFQEVMAVTIDAELPGVNYGANPPQNQTLPYIQFGQSEVADNFPPGHELLIMLHIWSKKEGPHEVKNYQHTIRLAMHDKQFTRGLWHFNAVREEFAETLLDPDGETWHGIQRFRAQASLL